MTQVTKAALLARVEALEKSFKREAGERKRLENALADSLEQQTATSEILRVISSSPTDIRPVLDALVKSATRFCGASDAVIFLREGDNLRVAAHHGPIPQDLGRVRSLARETVVGRSLLDQRTIHVADLQAEVQEFPEGSAVARRLGHRTILSVPLMRENTAIGVIQLRRAEVNPFADKQVALLQTFAAQAVIAIENVRLFKELEARNRDLTATGEILRAISSSPTDIQPVFDIIAESAVRLCGAEASTVTRFDGEWVHLVAVYGSSPEGVDAVRRAYPLHGGGASAAARSIRDRAITQIPDVLIDDEYGIPEAAVAGRFRAALAVPMLREGRAIGAIAIGRSEPGEFRERQVELLRTFADQALIAIENVRLFNETKEALEQQTATAEILRIISSSPTDRQPVFEAIVESARRLCEVTFSVLILADAGQLTIAAVRGVDEAGIAAVHKTYPMPISRHTSSGRAILDQSVVHIPDTRLDPSYAHQLRDTISIRSVLTVPVVREGCPFGALTVWRDEPRPFTEDQIALLKTFADQAVIAIENVRLFTELQASNRGLTAALDTQTATSDILRVISRSQTDVQPVFDAIVDSAVRLLGAYSGVLTRIKGDQIELGALTSTNEAGDAAARALYPESLQSERVTARALRERTPLNFADVDTDPRLPEAEHARARVRGYRSLVVVPMLRHDEAVGTIAVTRREAGGFSDDEIALLKTFAGQAVIAIENVRLFTELQEKNRALTDAHAQVTQALEQQTATSEVLKLISRSAFDLQPVLETLVENAVRLAVATWGHIYRFDGEVFRTMADYGMPSEVRDFWQQTPLRPGRGSGSGRAALERRTIHIPDVLADPDYELAEEQKQQGVRSLLCVPVLSGSSLIGVFALLRTEVRPFTDKEIELVTTFADQAAIAIENSRLLSELQARTAELTRSVEQLTALGEVSRAVSSTLDLETVLTTIVSRAVELSKLDGGVVFEYEEATEEFVHRAATETGGALAEARRATRVQKGEGVVGRTAITLEPVQVPDITVPGAHESRLRENLIESGVRAILAVPMVREGRLIGSLVVSRNHPGNFPIEVIELLRTFATQSALAIQNARLFREIADKSRQLEAASRHKSEFLANMSHELRTPLNAIIGFSEVLAQGMFGGINDKQTEYLHDILESGRHLLSLINDILDLSKIEAGRMDLELSEFDLPQAIQNALTLVRERALRRGIALHHVIDDQVADIRADERKIKQVLLNLLSNAIKFTPEGGRIEVRAAPADGLVEVSVTDTGIGIAPEDLEAVFEEFRQVGTADRKAEGTGLGLALSRKFVELHGGRISVKSQIGVGSTFTFTLPLRHSR